MITILSVYIWQENRIEARRQVFNIAFFKLKSHERKSKW